MEKTIRERVLFIRKVRNEHGLSAEKISDIVSRHGEYVSITTIRRVIAKDAENKRFRIDTIAPIYDALHAEYGESTLHTPCGFNFAGFDRGKYESLIISLRDSNDKLRKQVDEQSHKIEKQGKIIEILWHGLVTFGESKEGYAEILKYALRGGVKHG